MSSCKESWFGSCNTDEKAGRKMQWAIAQGNLLLLLLLSKKTCASSVEVCGISTMYLFLPQAQDPCSESMTGVDGSLEVFSRSSRKMKLLRVIFSKQSLLPDVARE